MLTRDKNCSLLHKLHTWCTPEFA